MITEPDLDRASLLAEQKLRDHIESFERKFLDYRFEEVEDGTQTSEALDTSGTAETPSIAPPNPQNSAY